MKKITCIIFILGFFLVTKAQNDTVPFTLDLNLTFTGIVNNQYDSVYNYKAIVTLTDSLQILKIYVKIGTSSGSDDIFNYGFSYANHNGLPPGTAWQKTGNVITLTLGEFVAKHYFFEVYLHNKSGDKTEAIKWD
jgi:hypothetical protein